jgi:hypothetical protein
MTQMPTRAEAAHEGLTHPAISRAVHRASQSLGGLDPLSSYAQRQFCKHATPFHDPVPQRFLQFHARRLWCGAEPDTSPLGAGMQYSRCAKSCRISSANDGEEQISSLPSHEPVAVNVTKLWHFVLQISSTSLATGASIPTSFSSPGASPCLRLQDGSHLRRSQTQKAPI